MSIFLLCYSDTFVKKLDTPLISLVHYANVLSQVDFNGAFVSCGITRVYNSCSRAHKSCVFLSYHVHQNVCMRRQAIVQLRNTWVIDFSVCLAFFFFTFMSSARVHKKVT